MDHDSTCYCNILRLPLKTQKQLHAITFKKSYSERDSIAWGINLLWRLRIDKRPDVPTTPVKKTHDVNLRHVRINVKTEPWVSPRRYVYRLTGVIHEETCSTLLHGTIFNCSCGAFDRTYSARSIAMDTDEQGEFFL